MKYPKKTPNEQRQNWEGQKKIKKRKKETNVKKWNKKPPDAMIKKKYEKDIFQKIYWLLNQRENDKNI